jgi:hypothetical protein
MKTLMTCTASSARRNAISRNQIVQRATAKTLSIKEPPGAVDVGGNWYVAAAKSQLHSAPLSNIPAYVQRRA